MVDAFFSSLLHSFVHLLLIQQVSRNSPVHLRSNLVVWTPQARLEKHGGWQRGNKERQKRNIKLSIGVRKAGVTVSME